MSLKNCAYLNVSACDNEVDSLPGQIKMIEDYHKKHYPEYSLDFFIDYGCSGYFITEQKAYHNLRKLISIEGYKKLLLPSLDTIVKRQNPLQKELDILKTYGIEIEVIDDN